MKSLLYILETAAWTFVGVLVLVFFYGFLIIVVFNYQLSHTDLPWGLFWPLIWGAMGTLMMGIIIMAWWWGRMLRDREDAEQWLADYEANHPSTQQVQQTDCKELNPWRFRDVQHVPPPRRGDQF
jgi:uncharacterized integral membrane protein